MSNFDLSSLYPIESWYFNVYGSFYEDDLENNNLPFGVFDDYNEFLNNLSRLKNLDSLVFSLRGDEFEIITYLKSYASEICNDSLLSWLCYFESCLLESVNVDI